MARFATLPVVADRAGPCIRQIRFRGLDLAGVALAGEIRNGPDVPGAPAVQLGQVTVANAEGLRLVGVETDADGVKTSTIALRINETTMRNAAAIPYVGELGDASEMSIGIIGIFGQDKRLLLQGPFVALATTFGATNAPASRPESYGRARAGGWGGDGVGTVVFSDETIEVTIDGADLIQPQVDAATAAAANANALAVALAGPVAAARYSFLAAASQGALLFTAFRSDQSQVLDLFTSFDGLTLTRISDVPALLAPEGDTAVPQRGVRDPAPVFWDGWWYVFYTPAFNSADIGIARTRDFVDWERIGNLSFVTAAQPNTKLAWAPRPFIDPATGFLWLETALSDNIDGNAPTHYMTVRRLTGARPTGSAGDWANPVDLGHGVNFIDGATYREGGVYFHFVKNETTKYVERFQSATYPNPGGWTKTGAGNWSGIQGAPDGAGRASLPLEAPRLVYHQGQWRMYLDPFNGTTYYVSTGASLAGNAWSAPALLNVGGRPIRHFNPIALTTEALKTMAADAAGALAARAIASGALAFAAYLRSGMGREAHAMSMQALRFEGDTLVRTRSDNPYALWQARLTRAPGDGFDLILQTNGGYGSIETTVGFVAKEALTWDIATGRVDAPQGFKALPEVAVTGLQNGWAAGSLAPRLHKARTGLVSLTGNINKSSARTAFETIFVLPAGYRPARLQLRAVVASDTQLGTLAIHPDGRVQWGAGAGVLSIDLTFVASEALA